MSAEKKVLVIKLGALGDVVLSVAHIERIIEAHQDARVLLLTAPDYVDLLSGIPGLDVVAFPRKGFVAMARLLTWVLRQSFDAVYDLQGSTRSRIVTLLTQAQQRIGETRGIAYTHSPPAGSNMVHAFQRLNEVLIAGGIEPALSESGLVARSGDEATVDAWLNRHELNNKKLVLMHAGSSQRWLSKRWDESHFAGLAAILEQQGFTVLWIGGNDELELNHRLAAEAGIDATGAFAFPELLALGRRCQFAVTNDSSPMHILAAAGLPVFAFFGPTDWRQSHALSQQDRVLTHPVACSPCYLKQCPAERGHQCMKGVTPAMVMQRLQSDGLCQ